jgi:hypothetical protein
MLFGNFLEASKGSVDVGYPGEVLKAVVEFIYTDTLEQPPLNVEGVVILPVIAAAASYFNLPMLYEKVKTVSQELLREKPQLACAFLESCRAAFLGATSGGDEDSDSPRMDELALTEIRCNATQALMKDEAFACLCKTTLEEIISDTQLEAEELEIFMVVKSWIESKQGACPTTTTVMDWKEVTSQLMSHIRFENIDPKELSTTVACSGFVTDKVLFEAYKTQALVAVQKHNVEYSTKRCDVLMWKDSQGDLLECSAGGKPALWTFR